MIKALLRYLLFECPIAFYTGLVYIIFDKEEIIQTQFRCRRQWRPDIKKQVLNNYLNKCFKAVHEEESEKDEKKRLDKD